MEALPLSNESLPEISAQERSDLEREAGRRFKNNHEAQVYQRRKRMKEGAERLDRATVVRDVLNGDI
jgi:hypothetical protein